MFSPSKGEEEIFSHSSPPPLLGNEAYFAIVGEERGEGEPWTLLPKREILRLFGCGGGQGEML